MRLKVAEVQYYATIKDEHGTFPVFLNRVKRWDDGSVERYEQAPTAFYATFKEAIDTCGEWNSRLVQSA